MIIFICGWYVWFMVQMCLALWTPFRPFMLGGRYERRLGLCLRMLNILSIKIRNAYNYRWESLNSIQEV